MGTSTPSGASWWRTRWGSCPRSGAGSTSSGPSFSGKSWHVSAPRGTVGRAGSRAGRRRREADDRRGHGIRPPGRPPKGGRSVLRRAPGRHGLPRHHLHRPAGGPPGGDRGVGRGHGLVPGRDRQPRRRASSRLGLRTALAAAFGDDDYGDFCWRTLEEQEHVDLSLSRRFDDWHSPVTVSMSVGRDRSMVTHGHAAPVGTAELMGPPPPTRSVLVDLGEVVRRRGGGRRGSRPPRRTAPWSSPTSAGTPPAPGGPSHARPARALPRVPAQRRGGDGLHPHRHARRTRSTPSPTACPSPS